MTVVLVHGNPETDAVWGPLVAELDRTGEGRHPALPAGMGRTLTGRVARHDRGVPRVARR